MQRICIARYLLWTGVCPLQVGIPSNRTNGSNCFYGIEAHIGLSYTCVIREFGNLQIHNHYTSLCNKLSQTLKSERVNFSAFSHGTSTVVHAVNRALKYFVRPSQVQHTQRPPFVYNTLPEPQSVTRFVCGS